MYGVTTHSVPHILILLYQNFAFSLLWTFACVASESQYSIIMHICKMINEKNINSQCFQL